MYHRLSFAVMRGVAKHFVVVSQKTLVDDCISRHDAMPLLLLLGYWVNLQNAFKFSKSLKWFNGISKFFMSIES